jgi:hypothetical protein
MIFFRKEYPLDFDFPLTSLMSLYYQGQQMTITPVPGDPTLSGPFDAEFLGHDTLGIYVRHIQTDSDAYMHLMYGVIDSIAPVLAAPRPRKLSRIPQSLVELYLRGNPLTIYQIPMGAEVPRPLAVEFWDSDELGLYVHEVVTGAFVHLMAHRIMRVEPRVLVPQPTKMPPFSPQSLMEMYCQGHLLTINQLPLGTEEPRSYVAELLERDPIGLYVREMLTDISRHVLFHRIASVQPCVSVAPCIPIAR